MSSQISKVELLELAAALGIAPPAACTARYIFAKCLERARELSAAERRQIKLVPGMGGGGGGSIDPNVCPQRLDGRLCSSGNGRFGERGRCLWCDRLMGDPIVAVCTNGR